MIIKKRPTLSQKIDKITLSKGLLTVSNDYSKLLDCEVRIITEDYLRRVRESGSTLMPVDEVAVNKIVIDNIKKRNAVGILRHDGDIIGGIIGVSTIFDTYSKPVLHHTLYNSSCTGLLAAHAAMLAFRFLIEFARRNKITCVYAACASWDHKHSLIRILKRDGWHTEGYAAVYHLDREDVCHQQ